MNYLSNKKMILGVILCVLDQVFIQLATVPVVFLALPELLESLWLHRIGGGVGGGTVISGNGFKTGGNKVWD